MVIYEQKEPENPQIVKEYFFWNTRGRMVLLKGEKDIKDVLSKGFRRASQAELKRFKPGDYFAIYDFGGNTVSEGGVIQAQGITQPDLLGVIVV